MYGLSNASPRHPKFPPPRWPIPEELGDADLFDARRRPWFARGTTLPKDIIILMDRWGEEGVMCAREGVEGGGRHYGTHYMHTRVPADLSTFSGHTSSYEQFI